MPKRLRALVVAFFPAFEPPYSGGEMRLGSLYRHLSRHLDVMLVTSTDFGARFERIERAPGFTELRFPKEENWRKAYAALERQGLSGDLAGLAFALAVADPQCELRIEARRLASEVDIVIHEFPFSEPIFNDGCPVPEFYNAHNVEAVLFSSIVRGPGAEAGFLKLLRIEGNLLARVRKVFAPSQTDLEIFRLFYGVSSAKLALCPNGFDERAYDAVEEMRWTAPDISDPRPRLLFMGSAHPPNVEAAQFLLRLASSAPDLDLVIAGGVCSALTTLHQPPNVTMEGPFDPRRKLELLASADLFVNPVVEGSGTSLKALEALAAALPMVTTPEGVRGLDLDSGIHAAIVPRGRMVEAIRELLGNPRLRETMAEAGRDAVRARYGWSQIAKDLAASLDPRQPNAIPAEPLVLAFNDYALDGLHSGGAERIRGLLRSLERDVVLVSYGDTFKISLIDHGFLSVSVAKSNRQRDFEQAIKSGRTVSADDVVATLFTGSDLAVTEIASRLLQRAVAAIFEHPYMAPLVDSIKALRPDLPIVYSAHNLEAEHKGALFRGDSIGPIVSSFVDRLERELTMRADLVVACTKEDVRQIGGENANVVLAENGCAIPVLELSRPERGAGRFRAGFLGSAHPPNVEAAQFILSALAPHFEDAQFEFVGSVCDGLAGHGLKNVKLHSVVPNASKSEILSGWDLALNPLLSGGGSSIKLPDYLAHGLATLNTLVGARGFPVAELGLGAVVERDDFPLAFARLMKNRADLRSVGARARAFALKELSWQSVTVEYRKRLAAILAPLPMAPPATRLLVVTYRYTEPALGGAEEYLIAVLQRLRARFTRIDLAAVDIEHLGNRHHYGCHFNHGPGAAGRIGELFDSLHFFAPQEPREDELVSFSRTIARDWAREELALMAPLAARLEASKGLHMLAGFFMPEKHDNIIRRWTSPNFTFLAPRSARVLRLQGIAPKQARLRLSIAQMFAEGRLRVIGKTEAEASRQFDLNFALPESIGEGPVFLLGEVEEFLADGDIRPLGLLLESASVLCADDEPKVQGGLRPLVLQSANLAERLDNEWRDARLEEWIDSLVAVARRRSPETDAAFARARGPHAPEMQKWIAEHAGDYDVVLVQGVPFDVVPRTVETLSKLPRRPRIVTLPHFHGDDRFYHWRDYYRAFEAADRTLLFSEFLSGRIAPREKVAIVNGGGVRLDEATDPTAAQRFRAVHTSRNPFFLVLGRKADSKHYRRVIDAHRQLRRLHPDVELVMIGPDDDGAPVAGEGLAYLGRQPRNVVCGALSECLAVVNMSASESFGIVICEAWLFRKPVIANAKCYAFRALIREGVTGLLVEDNSALLAAMERLAVDAVAREGMGRAGFEEVVEKYSWERVADAIAAELLAAA